DLQISTSDLGRNYVHLGIILTDLWSISIYPGNILTDPRSNSVDLGSSRMDLKLFGLGMEGWIDLSWN
ncbi:hypothetical protein MKX03_023545, partial [Papaver bracteatum]